jgi:L-alanine-DL-glutamate epimerase-like enolase superfamily enzyme
MKITDIRATLLSSVVPEDKRWRTDLGVAVKLDNCIVEVDTDEGITGIGAGQGNPTVVKAIVETQLKPQLIGQDATMIEGLWERMYSGSRGQPALDRGHPQPGPSRRGDTLCAMAGVDIALWDILGKSLETPVYKLLGASRTSVRGYASGGWAPGESAGDEMAGYASKGFSALKMRAEGRDGFSIAKTRTRVDAARRAVGPEVEIMVDAHGSLDVSTAKRLARVLEEYDVAWFEEPVSYDNHVGQADLRASTTVPISSGESESTRFEVLDLLRLNAVDVLQPDVAIAGGLTESRRIATLAHAFGVRIAPHVWSSGVIVAASIHLAMHAPACHIFEVSQSASPLIWELFEEPFPIKDGRVQAVDRPGLGFTLRKGLVEKYPFVPGPAYVY